jgi:hypothetical protein
MLLIGGKILASDQIDEIIPTLEKRICATLKKGELNPFPVIEACHKLAEKLEAGDYNELLHQLLDLNITEEQIQMVIRLMKRDSLLYKLKVELGENYDTTEVYQPLYRNEKIHKRIMPLGVLFHIAAGNVEGLPAYSVIEGLLAGNINLLKLPSADRELTIKLLAELVKLEPELADYIYVFDTPSNDILHMRQIARSADAIVLWGGDEAIRAVRQFAAPNSRIIEWGHKISFAYITELGMVEQELTGLAHHILRTGQLLCSSCQGIYIDTDRMEVIYEFCHSFLTILEEAAKAYPEPPIGVRAQITLLLYHQELSDTDRKNRVFQGQHCSITAMSNKRLEVSYTNGNCWVKPLSRKDIIRVLHHHRGYLQTVGLLCAEEEREELSGYFLRAGATRITTSAEMSRMLCGESHDGEYPLRRYSKTVEF